jgi:hypothetical protein
VLTRPLSVLGRHTLQEALCFMPNALYTLESWVVTNQRHRKPAGASGTGRLLGSDD